MLAKVQIDRAGKGMVPMKQLKVWSDNAGDLKSSDVWDQWRKILSAQDDQTGLSHAVLRYHAKQEGKTRLDGFFGRQQGHLMRCERAKLERHDTDDLFDAFLELPTSHITIIEVDRENESRFYRTGDGGSALHSVEVTAASVVGHQRSTDALQPVDLGVVKERKTKAAQRKRDVIDKQVAAGKVVSSEYCQTCELGLKKGETLDHWIQCEACDRSWHKTW